MMLSLQSLKHYSEFRVGICKKTKQIVNLHGKIQCHHLTSFYKQFPIKQTLVIGAVEHLLDYHNDDAMVLALIMLSY